MIFIETSIAKFDEDGENKKYLNLKEQCKLPLIMRSRSLIPYVIF